jgi:hypothetical protein
VILSKAHSELLTHREAQAAAKKGGLTIGRRRRFARRRQGAATVSEVFEEWLADSSLLTSQGWSAGPGPDDQHPPRELRRRHSRQDRRRKVSKLTREALQACIDAPRKRGAPGALPMSIAR